MLLLEIVIGLAVSITCAWFAAKTAQTKGRSPVVWGILGFVFPFIGLLVIALLPPSAGQSTASP